MVGIGVAIIYGVSKRQEPMHTLHCCSYTVFHAFRPIGLPISDYGQTRAKRTPDMRQVYRILIFHLMENPEAFRYPMYKQALDASGGVLAANFRKSIEARLQTTMLATYLELANFFSRLPSLPLDAGISVSQYTKRLPTPRACQEFNNGMKRTRNHTKGIIGIMVLTPKKGSEQDENVVEPVNLLVGCLVS